MSSPPASSEQPWASMRPEHAETYAAYGFAVASGQMLEIFLGMFVAAVDRLQPSRTRVDWIEFLERLEDKTLGYVINELKELGAPDRLLDVMRSALRLRNHLVHDYFREPEQQRRLNTSEGRKEMIVELTQSAATINEGSVLVLASITELGVAAGITPEALVERADEVLSGQPSDIMERRVKVIAQDDAARRQIESQYRRAYDIIAAARRGREACADDPKAQP